MKLILTILTALLVNGCSFASERLITINIEAKELTNEKMTIAFPYFKEKISINSKGLGEIKVPFKDKTFAILSFYNSKKSTYRILFFDQPGNLSIRIKKGNFSFSGDEAKLNSLVLSCDQFIEPRQEKLRQLYDLDKSMNEIVSSYLRLDDDFRAFYLLEKKKFQIDRESDYLLYNHFRAKLLGQKQQMILLFEVDEADSLQLVKILGIDTCQLYSDSILLKSGSVSFKNFLYGNCDFKLRRTVPFATVGVEKYPLAVYEHIFKDSVYSIENKEYLIYANVIFCMSNLGVTEEIEMIIEQFNNLFPNSYYSEVLYESKIKFDKLTKGKPAPNWNLKSIDGSSYSLDSLKGKTVFIDVWATWCQPCIKAMPKLLELQKEYSNIYFVFISIDKDKNQWKKFLDLHPENNNINLISEGSEFELQYRITSVPRQILIDKDGNIIEAFVNHEELIPLLESYSKN